MGTAFKRKNAAFSGVIEVFSTSRSGMEVANFHLKRRGKKYEKDVWQCAYGVRVCIRRDCRDQHNGRRAVVE
jgi:hypothetical protein